MLLVEAVLGIILAFMCIMCGGVIIYDCFVESKNVKLVSKRLSVIYALAFIIIGIVIFAGIILNMIDGGGLNVRWK